MGFSIGELRRMTMSDFIAYADCAAEGVEPADAPRQATQEDIDAFYM